MNKFKKLWSTLRSLKKPWQPLTGFFRKDWDKSRTKTTMTKRHTHRTGGIGVDYLSAILARLAPRQTPSSYRSADGELRVITEGASFESLLAESFGQIRSNAKGNLAIMLRMLGAIQTLISLTASPQRRRALREHVQWIAELAERTLESAHERAGIDARLALVREALKAEPALCAGEENTN